MKNSLLHPSVVLGLVALIATIFLAVLQGMPLSGPISPEMTLKSHQRSLYFIDAKGMARRLYPDPAAHWMNFLDQGSICQPIGNDVWYARGLLWVSTDAAPAVYPWEVAFVPGEPTPIFTRVGDTQSGDVGEARRRAGIPQPAPGGHP